MNTVYTSEPIHHTGWYRASQVVSYLLYLTEGLLLLRFAFRIIGASSAAPFSAFIYRITQPFVALFTPIIRSTRISEAIPGVMEWSTLIAMTVFWLIAWAIIRLFSIADTDEVMTEKYYNLGSDLDYNQDSPQVFFEDDAPVSYRDYAIRKHHPRL